MNLAFKILDKPWYAQLLDQATHALLGCAFIAPVVLNPCPLTAAIAGAGLGFVRELTEEGRYFSFKALRTVLTDANSMCDVAFWTLGGLLAGALF